MYPERFGLNPLFPKASDFTVERCDRQQGLGVRSLRSFRDGELLAEFTGDIVYERTQHSLEIDETRHINDLFFVGYLLHSCSPNVVLDMEARRVYACADIDADDFLRMDYAQTESVLFKQFPCSCQSPDCRKWITGHQEAPAITFLEFAKGQEDVA